MTSHHAPAGLAFYDLDGTLVSGNVVRRYAFFARRRPSRAEALVRCARLLGGVPYFLALDRHSRRRFNEVFFREYRGLGRDWLQELAEQLFVEVVRPSIYPRARAALAADRAQGCRLVLVTGELDLVARPVGRELGFDEVVSNALAFEREAATGGLAGPVVAEQEKACAIATLCRRWGVPLASARAYSDSFSDLAMLEVVGQPAAVNPDRRLRRLALQRGWPVLDWKYGNG